MKSQSTPDDFKKKRWSSIQTGLIDKIIGHIATKYGPDAIHEAWQEFHLFETEDEFDPHSTELPIFMPWFFYEWFPDPESILGEGAPNMPPAQSLAESGSGITEDEKRYLLECCRTSFSFYEILEVVANKSMKLKDILTEDYHHVLERKGTQGVQKGDFFFGKVISIDDIGVLESVAPIVIRHDFKLRILELKKYIQKTYKVITQEVLHDYCMEILELYQAIRDYIINPPNPVLTNTDGHLFVPHKMIFDIIDPKITFDALCKLCFNETKEDLLAQASFKKNGELKFIEFPWLKKGNKKHKSWDNTVLGHIKIEGHKLTVEVNSQERARKFKSEIKKLMSTGWKLKTTLVEPIEAQLGRNSTPTLDEPENNQEHEELMNHPEVRNHMEKMMTAHWDTWIMEPLPALGGMKPIDAVKTKDGRDILESLLTQFERDAKERPMVGQSVETFKGIRTRLGLL